MNYTLKKLKVLLGRLAILFVLYQGMRLLFFLYNKKHFPDVDLSDFLLMMRGGLRFDLTALLYLNLLYIFLYMFPYPLTNYKAYRKFLKFLFLLTNSLGIAFNLMDIFYFDYVLKRSTVEIFMFTGEKNILTLFVQFFKDFWWGVVLFFLLVYLLHKWYNLFKDPVYKAPYSLKYFASSLTALLLLLYLSIVGIRGGFTRTTRPISINNAGAYINKPLEMAIVLNTPFTLIRTIDKKAFKPVHYFDEEEVEKIFSPEKHLQSGTEMQKKNVMIIIVESLAREYSGLLNKDVPGYKGYTPFLDSLMLQSHTFANAYSNGRKSIDAMPSILASVPSLVQPFVLSPYATNDMKALGTLLKEKDYTTAFFHGAPNGSMGFDAFAKLAGFDRYYGASEYGNDSDFDGFWGVPDDKFLQFTKKQLDTFRRPFAAVVFTLSSHHPFKLPKGFEGKFKGGPLPIHKVVEYTDYSLKHFFEEASKSPWFKNTIFVITADHCNQTYLPKYNSSIGRNAIPLIIYTPGDKQNAGIDSTLTQQVDIMPRILRELKYKGDIISFGNDPGSGEPPFAVNYNNGTWEFMQGDYLLRFRDGKTTGLFNYKKDPLLKKNILGSNETDIQAMENRLKAFIQQYVNRLIENRLTAEK